MIITDELKADLECLEAEHHVLEQRLDRLQRGYNIGASDEIRLIKKKKLLLKDVMVSITNQLDAHAAAKELSRAAATQPGAVISLLSGEVQQIRVA